MGKSDDLYHIEV